VPKPPAFVVAGPTGVGKSELAVELALRVGGEIVCADAFQIYRGLEVLTAQPPARLRALMPHHLYGTRDPTLGMTAADFARLAWTVAEEISARGRIPIFVGGAGFYLRALEGGLDPLPPPSPELRARITALSPDQALAELRMLDPSADQLIDIRNPRRVARALEIVLQTGKPLAQSRTGRTAPFPVPGIVLLRPRDELRQRIAHNVQAMLEAGAVEEVRSLPRPAPLASKALGFKQISAFLSGEIALEEARQKIFSLTWKYARRQLTWFRHQSTFRLLMLSGADNGQALMEAERCLRNALRP